MELDTRSKLIEIATPLFATKGFAAVSVREVTEIAGINVSAISYHFKGKEGLYQAVFEEQLSPILVAMQTVKENTALSPLERLTFYAEQIARIHAKRPFLSRFMSGEVNNPTEIGGPVIERHLSQVYQFLCASLQEGIKCGNFRPDLNVAYTAISLAGILNFFFLTKPIIKEIVPLPERSELEYTRHAFQIFLHGIVVQYQT